MALPRPSPPNLWTNPGKPVGWLGSGRPQSELELLAYWTSDYLNFFTSGTTNQFFVQNSLLTCKLYLWGQYLIVL
jgi:hypothetical protein